MTDTTTQAADAAFDIAAFKDVTLGVFKLRHPLTGAPTTATITLAGPEDPDRKRRSFDRQRRMRAELANNGKLPVIDPIEQEAEQLDDLVAATRDWSLVMGGQPLPFSAEAARALYADPDRRWLRDQVVEAMQKRELFISASATN
jgi:hypothetical protein